MFAAQMTPTPTPNPPAPTLVLASQSPRRAQLLRDAGYVFCQQAPPYADPDQPESDQPHSAAEAERFAADLAARKALSTAPQITGPALILAADTVCVSMTPGTPGTPGTVGRLIGKPRSRADALAMLRRFVNHTHAVVCGVALLEVRPGEVRPDTGPPTNQPTLLCDTATVTFGPLTDADLQQYLADNTWQDKAGGYNLTDRQRAGWPIDVKGDPGTVVGLPMRKLTAALAGLGIRPSPPSP